MNRFSEKTKAWHAPVFFALAHGREGFVWLGSGRRRSLLETNGLVGSPSNVGSLFELYRLSVDMVPPPLWPDARRILNPLRLDRGAYLGDLPEDFALYFAPLLRRERDRRRFLGLYWGLGLQYNPGLNASAHRLLLNYGPSAAAWLEPLLGQLPAVRDPLAALLVELEIPSLSFLRNNISEPNDFYAALCDGFHNIQGINPESEGYVELLYAFVKGVSLGMSYDHLLDGLRLHRRLDLRIQTREFQACPDYAPGPVGLMIELMRADDSNISKYQIRNFWQALGKLPGYVDVCREWLRWEFAAESLHAFLRFMDEFAPEHCRQRMWSTLRERLPALMRDLGLLRDAENRENQLAVLANFTYLADPETLPELWPRFRLLAAKLREYKLTDHSFTSTELLFEFALLDADLFAQCLHAPRSSFRRLDHASRSDNRRGFIDSGLSRLRRMLPRFLAAAFRNFPAKLLRSAELLGSLTQAEAMRTVNDFRRAGGQCLVECDVLSPLAVLAITGSILANEPGLFHPVPERLRAYLVGEIELTGIRLRHSIEVMQRDRTLTGLELLDRCIRRRLCTEHREPETADLHTFQMIGSLAKEDRNPLKKFLRAHARGRHDYLHQHPRNAGWIRERRKLNTRAWFDGLAVRRIVPGRSLSLAPERDPHEMLKMGTYAGSCTGLGGMHQYNAATTLLDANKLLIYARDANGAFVARQLLAVTDDERLACFEVYPTTDANIRAAFREYDLRFAERIGLDIVDDYNYHVSVLIGKQWYDDGIWKWDDDE